MDAKYFLDTRDKRTDGTIPLKVKIYQDRDNYTYISLKIYLRPEQWDGDKVVNHPDSGILNPRLRFYKLGIAKVMLDIDMSGEGVSINEARRRVKSAISGNQAAGSMTFTEYYQQHIDNLKMGGTRRTRTETFVKLNKFTNNKPIQFTDINVRWLNDFDRFMGGMSINARSVHMRNIRAVLNDAIDEEIAPEINPFRRFKIKHEATRKRALTLDQLKQLQDYPCESSQEQYRDIFMLMFYFCGINIVDLCNLKKITNGYIEYRRAKTGRLYGIKVEPEALAIIEKYRGKNYLLNILDRYKDYENYRHRLNMNLKQIGPHEIVKDKVGKLRKVKWNPLFPGLSTYWARHTWATIAAGLDIPKETIAAALGHGGNSVTDIYIDFDQRKIDEANRRVIDALKRATEAAPNTKHN